MMTTKTLTDYRAALDAANARFKVAQAAVKTASVPAADIDTGRHDEPITFSGWYTQRTISGRPAWRYCHWHNGRLHQDEATYDRAAHDELAFAGLAQYDAQRAYDDNHPAERAYRGMR